MVKIIRSRHFSREGTIDVMEIPFEPLPNLAALVFVHGDELHNILATYAPSVEPDLPESLMDMIQRGFSVKAERLWERVHGAKGIILAFDNNGNLVGCTAIRRDQRPYRDKVRQSFGVSVDGAYALNWVRARDEFKVREFYELIITTALAILEMDHVVYVTETLNDSRPAYIEALGNTGFAVKSSITGSPLAHLRLFVLQPEAPILPAASAPAEACEAEDPGFDAVPDAEDAEDACETTSAGVSVLMDVIEGAADACETAPAIFEAELAPAEESSPMSSYEAPAEERTSFESDPVEQDQEQPDSSNSGW